MNKGRSTYTFQLNCDPNLVNNLIQGYISGNGFTIQNKNGEQFYEAGGMIEGYRYFNYSILGQTLTIYAWLKGTLGNDITIDQNALNMPAMNYRNSLGILFQQIEKLNNQGVNMNNGMNFNSNTGQPINPNMNNGKNFDPNTGQPINPNMNNGKNFDPNTGQPINPNVNNGKNFDPNTGQPINPNMNNGMNFNSNTSQPINQNVNNVNSNQISNVFQNETMKKQETMCETGFWVSLVGLLAAFCGIAYGVIVYAFDFYAASQGLKTRKRGKAIATIVISIVSVVIIIFKIMAG